LVIPLIGIYKYWHPVFVNVNYWYAKYYYIIVYGIKKYFLKGYWLLFWHMLLYKCGNSRIVKIAKIWKVVHYGIFHW